MSGESVKPLDLPAFPLKNYKHWILDSHNDHIFSAELNISENDAKEIVRMFNVCWKEISALREALTKETERGADYEKQIAGLMSGMNLYIYRDAMEKLKEENAELRRHAEAMFSVLNYIYTVEGLLPDERTAYKAYEQFREKGGM